MLFTFVLTGMKSNGWAFSHSHQVNAPSKEEALKIWAVEIQSQKVGKEKLNISVKDAIEGEKLSPLNNMVNVWCFCFTLGKDGALLNVIKTESPIIDQPPQFVEDLV